MNAPDILFYGQRFVEKSLKDFPPDKFETPGACGTWSVKQIIAHLASYEETLVETLTSIKTRASTLYMQQFTGWGEEFNKTQVASRSQQSPELVIAELNRLHRQVMDLITYIPAEKLREMGTIPWYGKEYSVDDVIVYAYYGHKQEHTTQITQFIK